MSRRKPKKRRGLQRRTYSKTSKKRVIRKPLNIRYAPIDYLTQRLPRRNNRYIATHQTVSKPQRKSPNLLQQVQKAINKGMKEDCVKRKKQADTSRRREFFRLKGKGGTSQRPEHNRRYKKC